MKTLHSKLENCYGIKTLDFNFDFSKTSTYTIYAPNGVMKTSFAKVFNDLVNSCDSADLIFKDRKTQRSLITDTNKEIEKKEVFVIEPYVQNFKSDKLSTLLVNKALKSKYEEIHKSIDEKKEILVKELKSLTGLKSDIGEAFSRDFTHSEREFFKALIRVKSEILDKQEPSFENVQYGRIFTEKVVTFLETKDFKAKLKDYINKYNDLLEKSTYFKKGIFNHNNATTIAKNLKDNGFFKASHSVTLNSSGIKKEITNESELETIIQQEKDAILNNPELLKAFEEIDKKITSNQELRDFREYLEENQQILPELSNLNEFKQKLWIAYLKKTKDNYINLESAYSTGAEEISKIIDQAKKEETHWRGVIDEFNRRFSVPFKLSVDNQDDVILRSETPHFKFQFSEEAEYQTVEENDLFKVLSNGELRALYILNIIFEVEARRENKQDTLFIIDDIADSFDYKNKYAIIEYLRDISNIDYFKQIILTHNFDFYRTVNSRLEIDSDHRLNTIKNSHKVSLVQEKYQRNPFQFWKKNLHLDTNKAMLIASIPFIRNIAEYSNHTPEYHKLTSLLHIKEDTRSYSINDLEVIFKKIVNDLPAFSITNSGQPVLDVIYSTAEHILAIKDEMIDLENKISIAIAIRLKAEEYMILKINDDPFWKSICTNQTIALYNKYLEKFPTNTEELKTLSLVNLMTPENIHVNSFMYEPILDMAIEHLKNLYLDVKDKLK